MKLIHFSGILVLFSSIGVSLSEEDSLDDRKGDEIPDVTGTWKSERTNLTIYPDGRFKANGGPKIEYGVWEKSKDVGFYLRYRARNKGDAGLSRAGHFVLEQGQIVFHHDDEIERLERVAGIENTEQKGPGESKTPVGSVGTVKPMNDFSKRIASCLKDFEKLKPGMTRGEIRQSFPLDGGIHGISPVRLTHSDCPYLKVDVEFESKRDPDNQNRPVRGDDDRATNISKPYIEAPYLD